MSLFSNVVFNEKSHSYTIEGTPLTPVTMFISTFKENVDWDKIAQKVADKRGQLVDLILKEWEEKRDKGAQKGTYVHNFIEARLKGLSFSGQNGWYEEMSAFEKFWNEEKVFLTPIHIELRVGDKELGLGGTIDCIMFDSRTNKYHIYDWKTGSKFTIDNQYQSLLPPFDDLPDCHYVNYSMQLSAYYLILKRNTDLRLGQPIIIRLTEEGDFTKYPCLDFTNILGNYLLTEF